MRERERERERERGRWKFLWRNESAGQKEGERKWDWQEPWRGWNEQGVGERASETEGERNRGRCREMEKVGGRNRLRERNGEESEAFWIFSLQDFVSVAQWSFSSSGKKTFFLCLTLPPPSFFSDSVFLSPSAHFSQPLHHLPRS